MGRLDGNEVQAYISTEAIYLARISSVFCNLAAPPPLAIKLDCPGLCKGFGWLLLSQAFGCVDCHCILLKI